MCLTTFPSIRLRLLTTTSNINSGRLPLGRMIPLRQKFATLRDLNGFKRLKVVESSQNVNLTDKPDPYKIKCDYVGPPDTESNLRTFIHHISPEETQLAKNYRLRLLEVEAWNQEFWSEHNRRFYKEKEDFIRQNGHSGEDKGDKQASSGLSDDEMSVFYKQFLDENHQMHVQYNFMWYRKNLELLIMAFRVELERFINRFKERRTEGKF